MTSNDFVSEVWRAWNVCDFADIAPHAAISWSRGRSGGVIAHGRGITLPVIVSGEFNERVRLKLVDCNRRHGRVPFSEALLLDSDHYGPGRIGRRRLVLMKRFGAVQNRPFRINLNRCGAACAANVAGLQVDPEDDAAVGVRQGNKEQATAVQLDFAGLSEMTLTRRDGAKLD
jgi:hypothetical protein